MLFVKRALCGAWVIIMNDIRMDKMMRFPKQVFLSYGDKLFCSVPEIIIKKKYELNNYVTDKQVCFNIV